MLFSAQRVLTNYGAQGINSYRYAQPTLLAWPFANPRAALGDFPVQLLRHHLVVPAGGNRVRSYVDIAAPPGITAEGLSECIHALAGRDYAPNGAVGFPAFGCAIHYVAEPELWLAWPGDFLDLSAHAILTG